MPFADLGKERLYYTLSNPGARPVLLLIHGSGGSHRHWPEGLRSLDGVCVAAVDLPGHGRSTGKSRTRVASYADVIDDFVAKVSLDRVTLAGHSLGGAVAQTLALRSPAWLSRIILVGTGCRMRVMPAIMEGMLTDFGKTVDMVTAVCFGPDASPAAVAAVKDIFIQTPAQVTHDDFSACNAFDITDRIAAIDLPALIVCGSADRLTPVKYGSFLHRYLPDSKMVVIERGGHMMALEKPEAVAACFSEFILI